MVERRCPRGQHVRGGSILISARLRRNGPMEFKPADLFVGVIDLFAVLLPGAIVAALLYPHIQDPLTDVIGPMYSPARQWVAFGLGAYLLGHILFLCGAVLDDHVYDPLRRFFIPKDKDELYPLVKRLRDESVGS